MRMTIHNYLALPNATLLKFQSAHAGCTCWIIKTSTDFHQCWSLNLFTLFFVPNRLYAHNIKQESKDRHADD